MLVLTDYLFSLTVNSNEEEREKISDSRYSEIRRAFSTLTIYRHFKKMESEVDEFFFRQRKKASKTRRVKKLNYGRKTTNHAKYKNKAEGY